MLLKPINIIIKANYDVTTSVFFIYLKSATYRV